MKKVLSFMLVFMIVCCSVCVVFAADGYNFDLQYTGTIVKNVQKNASVLLIGSNATPHSNVRIKVDITGPATPEILATDSTGVEHDIAQLGYWGPAGGFAVGGDFVNTTPIKATFPQEGTYNITLSLIDVGNGNAVLETKSVQIEVFEDDVTNNIIENNIIENNVVNGIEELPKTGRSVIDYALFIIALTIVISIVRNIFK